MNDFVSTYNRSWTNGDTIVALAGGNEEALGNLNAEVDCGCRSRRDSNFITDLYADDVVAQRPILRV